jgi:peptidoglycan hydrolase-like protein with peptidoglycan-binding domain
VRTFRLVTLAFALTLSPALTFADALTQIVQRDLVTLGYEPGNTDGEATVETAIAISKFQAEHDLEITGEASPQLAGIIKAEISGQSPGGSTTAPVPPQQAAASPPTTDPTQLQMAQQACLQQKMAEAQESQQRKRGFARLARAISRTASEFGAGDISSEVASLSSDVYSAGAIADDFMGAAEDLGLTESDIEACRNPS